MLLARLRPARPPAGGEIHTEQGRLASGLTKIDISIQ
jgi:hypothetical protein